MRGDNTTNALLGDLPSLVALSHELKAPLGLIRQLALSRQYYDGEEAYHKALRRIELTAERSLRLIESLTRVYRADELESEPIHLGRLCEEVAHELVPLSREVGQPLQLHIPRQPVLAVGNRDLLGSVIYGLCDNAFHYASSEKPVSLKVQRYKGKARLSVIDKGPELSRKELREMKTKLGVAPQALSMRPGSSGLGLYIAGQFSEAMKAELGVGRALGGHRFSIDLPESRQLSFLRV